MYVCLLHTEVFNTHMKLISKSFVVYFPGFCWVTSSFNSNLGYSSNHIHALTLMWCTSEVSYVTPCGPLHPLDFRRKEQCACSTDFSYRSIASIRFPAERAMRMLDGIFLTYLMWNSGVHILVELQFVSQVTCKPSQSMRDKVTCVKHYLSPWFSNECKYSLVTYPR